MVKLQGIYSYSSDKQGFGRAPSRWAAALHSQRRPNSAAAPCRSRVGRRSAPGLLSPSLSGSSEADFPHQYSLGEKFTSHVGNSDFLFIFNASLGKVRWGELPYSTERMKFSCIGAKNRHPKFSDPNLQPSISSRVGPADSDFLLASDFVY